jgi:diaminopimelate decarboxylase
MLACLAGRFGTPAYLYDLDAVRRAHRDLVEALPAGAILHYSLKANPHPGLIAELTRLGCHAEVSSAGELEAALSAGVPPGHVQLTGPGKTDAAITAALGLGVTRFSVDSPHDLDRVSSLAAHHGVRAGCLLRVNADEPVAGMGLAMTGVASQFGADASWIARRPDLFGGRRGASVIGLHFYAGTNLQDSDALLRQFEVSVRLAARIFAVTPGLTELNLGGGFAAPYARAGRRPRYGGDTARRLADLLDGHLPGWRHGSPAIGFESGRYLVGDSGTLVCQILDVKVSKGKTFVVVDAGVNHLGGMSGLRRLTPLTPTVAPLPTGDSPGESTGPTVTCSVVGPLCTPLDTLAHSVPLADPRPGRLIAIPNVGAYGLTASLLAFLGHPAPVEIVVDGARLVDVSRLRLSRSPACLSTSDTRQGALASEMV